MPQKKKAQVDKMLEVFKQVQINIPLLDAIQQVPSYAKFLKDLCTFKKNTNVPKKTFLVEQASSIISYRTPVKYKDPRTPTISIKMGEHHFEKALLDLGASVNLLPYIVYETLGLGELKPTKMTLSFADRSIKIPRGVVENVLIKVGEFIFPVDFVVLDTQHVLNSSTQIPIILDRPFLATSDAVIRCRSGQLNLSFGNMTMDLNVFNLDKPSSDEGENEVKYVQEVNNVTTPRDSDPIVLRAWPPDLSLDMSLEDFEEEFGPVDEDHTVEVQL